MIIMKGHALILKRLGEKWTEGKGILKAEERLTDEEMEFLHQLYLQDLVYEEENEFILTAHGDRILNALNTIVEEGLLPPPEEWNDSFRWIGSEVISMIDVALRSQGFVEDKIKEALSQRGFVKGDNLTQAAYEVWEAYMDSEPRLLIPRPLAEFIKKIPPGPAYKKFLPPAKTELLELEAMRLLAFSIPVSDVYTLTGLGQQIRAAIIKGAPALPVIVDEEILDAIYSYAVESYPLPPYVRDRLLALAYITEDENLTDAGRHLLVAARIYFEGPIILNPSIHLDIEDTEVLKKIDELEKSRESTVKRIEEELKKTYPDINVFQSVMFLESFRLIEPTESTGSVYYTLTSHGKRVLDETRGGSKNVPAFGVKAITMSRLEYFAPQPDWIQYAEKRELLGNGFPSKAGRLYAQIASRVMRLPFINEEMREVIHTIPYDRAIPFKKIREIFGEKYKDEKLKDTLMKLDAQALIDALPEDMYVLTEAGKKIKRAIQVVPLGTKIVLTPGICRILLAINEMMGVDERRRIKLPENLKEVKRISGLSDSIFEEEFLRAKRNRFIGTNSIFESGMLIIDALLELSEIRVIWEEIAV